MLPPSENVTVTLGDRSYDILISKGLLPAIGELISGKFSFPTMFIITDEQVAQHHLKTVQASLEATGIPFHTIILPAGEQSKDFATLENLLGQILDHQPERKVGLIALGGGVIGDLTGFAASILLRGVPFIQIPTTLLAQVDSSVGGKTGINTKHGKNLVGTFYQPQLVAIDLDVLSTLPKRQFLAGYAEVAKYGLIAKADFFSWLEANEQRLLERQVPAMSRAVKESCECKAMIVSKDEKESGQRALLNLGHTFGHAYEAVTGYSDTLLHGEAVAIGMVHALELSAKLGYCHASAVPNVRGHFERMGLPTSLTDIEGVDWSVDAIMDAMQQDKKVDRGQLVFILVKSIGEAFIARGVDEAAVRAVIEEDLA